MAATIPDVIVSSNEYVSLNTSTGIPVGSAMEIQLKSTSWIRLVEADSQPSPDTTDGILVTNMSHNYATPSVLSGSSEVWAICTQPERTSVVNVQLG